MKEKRINNYISGSASTDELWTEAFSVSDISTNNICRCNILHQRGVDAVVGGGD